MFATSMRIYRLLQMLNDLDDYSTPSEESPRTYSDPLYPR